MKKFKLFTVLLLVCLFFIVGCDQPSEKEHIHKYENEYCECGELDPNHEHIFNNGECICGAKEPHNHEYINGSCECGELDPKHEHSFNNGECICGAKEPHTHEYINGSCVCGKKPAQDQSSFFNNVFNHIEGYVREVVNGDLNLPKKFGSSDVVITYKSNNPEFLTDDGKRIDHEFDEEVSFTCTLQRNGQTYTKDFSFISLGISYKERLERAEQLIIEFVENNELVEGLKLPTELPNFGGRIRWVAEDPYLIYDFETLHLPKEAKTVRLMAEIVFPQSTSKIVTIPVELNARPAEITDLDYVMTFLETIYSESRDYMFMYDGTLAYLNRDLIVNIEDDLKETFYTYKTRPEVSQSVLDERVYPGYVMPNEDNVLWIVVHDTGLSTVGVDAERLAQNQWNSAYIGGGREASWTYTVDDFGIYQSYEDAVTLWHATDGRTQGGGNLNGIGIEMCVNADGNFEACFLNDARLIGHLLKTYNLGMLNMKQHFDFYIQKNCPQKIRDNDRWFEFLTVCIWEYISQTLLTEYEISYEIIADNLTTWPVDGMYDLTNIASGEPVHITYTVNGETLVIESIKK